MPTKSGPQYRLMQGIAHGTIKSAIGPSPEVAREMIEKTPSKDRKKFAKMPKNK